jgi:hypothetical protein
MDGRQEDADQDGAGKECVYEAKESPEQEAALVVTRKMA